MPRKKVEKAKREVKYTDIEVCLCKGPTALTPAMTRELLGWQEVADWDDTCCPEIKAIIGKNVRLLKDTRNRPLDGNWLKTLIQEHLQKRWRFNGESIVINEYDDVSSGQHRCVSHACADEIRKSDDHWKKNWPGEVLMETVVVRGIKEDDDTFKTLNCGKPQTFADVLYRSEYFRKLKPPDRLRLSRMLEYAVKLLWDRTGAKDDPYAPRRTIGESLEFLELHPRLLKAVAHIDEESETKEIPKYVHPGYAAGLMYLMGSSASDGERNETGQLVTYSNRAEAALDWSNWDKACAFWTAVSTFSSDEAKALRGVRRHVEGAKPWSGYVFARHSADGGPLSERIGVLAGAWRAYSSSKALHPAGLRLSYSVKTDDDTGEVISCLLDTPPLIGGIDIVTIKATEPAESDEPNGEQVEEIDENKATEKARKDRAEELKAKAAGVKTEPDAKPLTAAAKDMLTDLRSKHDGKVLLVQAKDGKRFSTFGPDAELVAKLTSGEAKRNPAGVMEFAFSSDHALRIVDKLIKGHNKVAYVRPDAKGNPIVTDVKKQ